MGPERTLDDLYSLLKEMNVCKGECNTSTRHEPGSVTCGWGCSRLIRWTPGKLASSDEKSHILVKNACRPVIVPDWI